MLVEQQNPPLRLNSMMVGKGYDVNHLRGTNKRGAEAKQIRQSSIEERSGVDLLEAPEARGLLCVMASPRVNEVS
jgi:hypothetical protein